MDIDLVEMFMALMVKHEIDELTHEGLVLKKSKHRGPPMQALPLNDAAALAQHLQPLPDEPWNAVPQEAVDKWAEKGSP